MVPRFGPVLFRRCDRYSASLHHEHRTGGLVGYLLRHTAHQETVQTCPPVGAHHDLVALTLPGRAKNSGHGLAFLQPLFHSHLATLFRAMPQRGCHLFTVIRFVVNS
jgi:hypothetical protein